jgi:hypothetical protein
MNAYSPPSSWTIETAFGYGESGHWKIVEPITDVRREPDRDLLKQAILTLSYIARDRKYRDISTTTLAVALNIAIYLPENRALPKVSVDEDGDVLMVWGEPRTAFALTIEGETLHMVANPGSASNHLSPLIYHGGYLPGAFLSNIPER